MGLKLEMAKAVGAASEWSLKHVFHRPAANFPGKVALLVDPQLIVDLRRRLERGSVVVAGTNGKTTVTNLIADALEAGGNEVVCNRTGANLDSGVATALLQGGHADWGVFESDELWLTRVVPALLPRYVVLLNLFRDQLDRMGEIALIQDSIASALERSPQTTLVYNADDPLCQAIADRVRNECVPFGIADDLGLVQNSVSDAGMCQRCDALLEYRWRQYGQLGSYVCPECGFERACPAYSANNVKTGLESTRFTLCGGALDLAIDIPRSGAYSIYNVLAAYAAADCCGVPFAAFERAVRLFDPQNGRLQRYRVDGADVLLNLAKNPTGFNQNLKIIMQDRGPKTVGLFINDKEADGHDISWLWDVDFQELAWADGLTVYAGGTRRNDLQVRLKHAGIDAALVEDADDLFAKARLASSHAACYMIANYTALPPLKKALDRLQDSNGGGSAHGPRRSGSKAAGVREAADLPKAPDGIDVLKIVHLYPTLLNLYGDGGNVTILANRMRWRGVGVDVQRVELGQDIDLARADIVFLGGGPDREQHLASQELHAHMQALRDYVEDDGVLLAICGGYQILGREWLMGDESVPGLGLIDATTKRAEGNARNRLVGNIVLHSSFADMPVVGYENHAGRTYLGGGCKPFGKVVGRHGCGNNGSDGADGVLYRNVIGTYLHGPFLSKNPEVADAIIERALARRAAKDGRAAPVLLPLDDAPERAANDFMCARLHVIRDGRTRSLPRAKR